MPSFTFDLTASQLYYQQITVDADTPEQAAELAIEKGYEGSFWDWDMVDGLYITDCELTEETED